MSVVRCLSRRYQKFVFRSVSDPGQTLSANTDILTVRGVSRSTSAKPATAHGVSDCESASKFPETAKQVILGDGHGGILGGGV